MYEDDVILSYGDVTNKMYEVESVKMPGLVYRVYAPEGAASGMDHFFYITLLGIVVISFVFLGLAFVVSRKYYMPIDRLEQMVSTNRNASEDEMEKIICGIQDLIGEKQVPRKNADNYALCKNRNAAFHDCRTCRCG